ncbi:NimA-related protein kinase 9 [Haematococcus lacustris]
MSEASYQIIKQVGKGAYGVAYIVAHKASGQRFVLKKVRLARQSFKERQASLLELQILSSLRHRNVLEFVEAWVEAGCVACMVVTLCESGDLATQLRLRMPSSFFPEEHLHEMLVQLASGLEHLHRNGIVHRDIKSSNILITACGCLKLADFGLAAVHGPGQATTCLTMVGTPGYMSPQLLGDKVKYDGKANDMWSLGCVLYEMSALKPAFSAFNMTGLVRKVTSSSPPALPSQLSPEWRGLVKALLSKEEAGRPSAEEVLALAWLQASRPGHV